MKKTLVIVVHPDLDHSVINKAWTKAVEGAATIHNLYGQYPDGRIDVAHEQALLEAHDRIIFQFPLYWYAA
ncbi:NAD(P)H-dependent oxidoreductase, partial [Porphyromonas loveana]